MKRKLWERIERDEFPKLNRLSFFGVPLDHIEPEDLDTCLRYFTQRQGSNQIIFLRTLDFMAALRRPHYMKMLQNAALVLPVSKGLERMARALGFKNLQCYYPFSVIIRLLNLMEEQGGGVYVLGDRPPYTQIVEKNIKQTFPALRIVGRYMGGFSKKMQESILTAISKASPNLLLCGSGLKGKDLWIHRHATAFPRGVQVWTPECFDFISSRKKRASAVAFRNGHEYFGTSMKKPERLFRLPLYVWLKVKILFARAFR